MILHLVIMCELEGCTGQELGELDVFVGFWEFDPKRSTDAPNSVTIEKLMQVTGVHPTKRIGLQYFIGSEVSQSITLDKDTKKMTTEAFIKAVLAWKKSMYLDGRKSIVKDHLFGKALAQARYDTNTKEIHYILDSLKVSRGRLVHTRRVNEDTMYEKIYWYPSSKDESVFITHHRVYIRKGSPQSPDEVQQNYSHKFVNQHTHMAKPIGVGKALGHRILGYGSEEEELEEEEEEYDEETSTEEISTETNIEVEKENSSESAENNNLGPPLVEDTIWNSLLFPVGGVSLSVFVFVLFVSFVNVNALL